MESNFISYMDTLLMYHLGIDPRELTDEEWAEKYAQLENIRRQEAEHS